MDPYVRIDCSLAEWFDLLHDAARLYEYQAEKGQNEPHLRMIVAMGMAMAARDPNHEDHADALRTVEGARTLEAIREGEGAARH